MKKYIGFKLVGGERNIRKDGSFPVCLIVRKADSRKVIFTGLSAFPEQWNAKFQLYEVDTRKKKLHPDREKFNSWLSEKKNLCEDIIKEYDKNRTDWTLTMFEQDFLNRSKHTSVETYFSGLISKLDKSGNIGNKNAYERTLYMLKLFDPDFSRKVFQDIDLKYINRFDDFLRIDRGCEGNTISYYMRTFRALLNRAIKEGETSEVTYPFGKHGYCVSSLSQETEKRYLPSQYIETLKTAVIDSPALQWSRNLFLFSYYCQGMAIVDMAFLTDKNVLVFEGGKYICYRRRKTESKQSRIIRIKITENIQSLMDWFRVNTKLVDNYLLPVITKEGYEGQKLYDHIRDRNRKFNKHLKTLGEALKFEGIRLSSYQARHSYAMRLKNSGIPEDVISEALGHKDLSTTKTYLDSFQNDEIARANEVL
jgi:integrase